HRELLLTARSEVALAPPLDVATVGGAEPWDELAARSMPALAGAAVYLFDSPLVHRSADLAAYAASSFPPGRPLRGALAELTHRVYEDFDYLPGSTTVSTPIDEVLRRRQGVCQDFAHLTVGCLRSMGLAARYVSGY